MSGFDWRRGTRGDRKSGYICASWNASVGKIRWRLLRSSTPLEQKNDAPRRPLAKTRSATVCAIVDFPVPASPLSQKTGGLSKPSVHFSISSNTLSRVLLRQPLRLPCRYPAPWARRQLFKTIISAVRYRSQYLLLLSERGPTSILLNRQKSSKITVSTTHNQLKILIIYGLLVRHLDQLPE